MNAVSVTALNTKIKALLEATFVQVVVQGEIGRVTHHSSGHIYFAIKDETSTIDCVMFKGNATRLKFRLENAQKVIIHGAVTLYAPQGRYQINCTHIEPDGAGALAVAYEQLKKKLASEGLFDESHKKPLPKYPKTVALITSKTGAALQDMLNVANRRWKLAKIICINTLVQGEMASSSIVRSIAHADTLNADVMVLARGGGSMEDLWCFNDEAVARAIFAAKTPVVSAIGHEIDFVISDFVADKRAPTPSAAIEMILPDQQEESMRVDELTNQLTDRFAQFIARKTVEINHLKASFVQLSLTARFQRAESEIKQLTDQLKQLFGFVISQKTSLVTHLKAQLEILDPAKRLADKTAQVVQNGKITQLARLKSGDQIELQDATTRAKAKVLEVAEI